MTEVNGWLAIPDAYAAQIFAGAGFDSITLDMQHGLFDEAAVLRTLMALSKPAPRRLVRTASNDPAIIGKVLDMGADGVIAPMISSPQDAARLAGACRYAPLGQRSYGPMLAALRPGFSPAAGAAGPTDVWAMIETAEGLRHADAIAAVDGITGLFVGPNDLALALGFGPGSDRREPELIEAFGQIITAAHAHGRRAGLFCASACYAREMAAIGFDMLTIVTDVSAVAAGAAAAIGHFEDRLV